MIRQRIKLKLTNLIKFLLLSISLILTIVLVGCTDKAQATEITLALESDKTFFSPGESVRFVLTANGEFNPEEASLVVETGNNNVTVNNMEILVQDNAVPGQTITVHASYQSLNSNSVTFSVSHIEATSIEINLTQDTYYSSEVITLNSTITPSNATRALEYVITEGQDKALIVDGNKLSINKDAQEGDIINLQAHMGEVYSQTYEITVTKLNDNMLGGIIFSEGSLTIDSTTDNLIQPISVIAVVINEGSVKEITTNIANLEIIEGEEVIRIVDNYHIEALNSGSAILSASYGQFYEELVVEVKMTPDQVQLPENFSNQEVEYNYQVSHSIDFVPRLVNDHNSKDLTMYVDGSQQAVFESENGEWQTKTTTNNISFDGSTITFNQTGDYTIYFESNTGCIEEVKSPSVTISINNGINVATKEEFVQALSPTALVEINIIEDIIFENGSEVINVYGDKILNGNGHKIDLSKQLTDAQMKSQGLDYGDANFLNFYSNDDTTPYNVTVQDLEIIGNTGMLSLQEFATFKGDSEDYVNDQLNNGNVSYFTETGYKRAISFNATRNINPNGSTAYTYCVPVVRNVTISQFTSGLNFEHCIDEIELNKQNARPAIDNVTMYDLFGDGVRSMGSKISVEDINFGTVGGSPLSCSATDVDKAGINRNEKNKYNILGNITCDNIIDGSSLYINAEIMATGGIANVFGGGLSGIINTVITAMSSELMSPYYGTDIEREMYQTINEGRSNIINTSGSLNTFNLMCFTRNGLDEYNFNDGNKSLIVDLDDQFFYNGLDTTHKFIRLSVYDVIMSIETLGSIRDLVIANADAIKPIQIVIINLNYQAQ